jgi:hypothetical protein
MNGKSRIIIVYVYMYIYRVFLNYWRGSVAYNFQTGNNKIKLIMEYESVTQKVFITYRINSVKCGIKLSELHFHILQ